MALWQIAQPLQAATVPWTAGSGTDFNWGTAANWSGGLLPSLADEVLMPWAIPNPGTLANPQGLTLGAGSLANSLWLQNNYTLSGGSLQLASGVLRADLATYSVLDALLTGNGGLTKTGGGSIRLGNAANNYTGATTIANGTLIIGAPGALGADTSAVVVNDGNGTPGNTATIGFGGGSLYLDGSAGGFTFSRDLSLNGQGPIGGRGAALMSRGDNTLSGAVSMAAGSTPRNTRLSSSNGLLTLSGAVSVGGTAATTISNLGGINGAGASHFALTGTMSGTGTLEKTGSGMLWYNPSDSLGFSGTLRVSGSAAAAQSSVRITNPLVLGTRTNAGTGGLLDMNGGVLEIRTNAPSLTVSNGSNANVYGRTTSTLFVDHALGGSVVNGTAAFGELAYEDNITVTLSSRNGYGMSFTTAPVVGSTAGDNNSTFTNSLAGTLTFSGNFWSNGNNTGARTLTIGGNGNTVLTGSIIASAAAFDHGLTKTGAGSLTLQGTASTLDGSVNVNGGAIRLTDFRSVNMHATGSNTGQINIGTTTTAGALIIGTATAPTAAGLTTGRAVNLAGTTGNASIYANQSGGNPAVFNADFTATGSGSKTLILGGTSAADNIINGKIVNNSGTNLTSLQKIGSGTWVLAGANEFTGTTTLVNGTLKLKANAATSTVLPATNAITLGNASGYSGATLEFVGQNGVNNTQALGTLTMSSGANTLRLTPGAGGTASVTFANVATGGGSTINIVGADFTSNRVTFTQLNAAAGSDGLASRTIYWNGADFAYRQGGVLRAPVYGTDSGFVTSATSLTAASNQQITGSFAANSASLNTLKINGAHTLTLNAGQTLTLSTTGGLLATGGASKITGGTALAVGGQVLVARVNETTDVLTIESVITGTNGLNKTGAGTLVLSGVNTLSGGMVISEGAVQLSGSGRLGAAADLTIRQGAVLDLNGVTPSATTNAFTNNGTVTNSSGAAVTFTVGGTSSTGTSYGIISETSGVIHLTKTGSGAQSWLGSSTYTGVTTIGSTGLVTVDALADIGVASGIGRGNAADSASNAASLVFNGSSGGLVYQGNIVDGVLNLGATSASTNRLFTLAGTGATLSSTAANGNAIVWSNTAAIVHAVVGAQSLIFTGTSTGDNTFNPQLTDSGTGSNITSVTKASTGQWNLGNSNNTYTGATIVSNGILGLNHNGALPANSPVVLGQTTSSGILQMSGTFERALAAGAVPGNGTITWGGSTGGGGFAAHTDKLVVAIGGLASPTALTWGSGGFAGTGGTQSLIFGSATGLAEVEFRNAINLGAAQRTITINDNTNTGADFATLSGVLSGVGGGLIKNGAGTLRLTAANTYTGVTDVNAGVLAVTSLGHSSSPAGTPTSVGVSGTVFDNSNAITIGNGTTGGAILQYFGPGETSDRKIRLNVTTGSAQIHADGTGPLILTNVANDMVAGAKTLFLRGSNTAGNMITSQVSNNAAGDALGVSVDGAATWILTNGANNYTGTTSASAGALGIGHDSALGGSQLTVSNGNVFAYGADRTLSNTLNLGNNATSGFLGDYSLTFTGTNNLAAGANNVTLNNSIVAGKSLTFNGLQANSLTANRTWTVDGPGETRINGDFTTTTAFGVAIAKTGDGTLVLGGTGNIIAPANYYNQAGAVTDVDRGTLKFSASNAISSASGAGGLTLSPELATGDTATLDLNGTTQTVNALTATTDGTVIINNTAATAATLRFGANNSAVTFGTGTGSYTITDTGLGALSLVKLGNTAATLGTNVTLTHQGSTAVEGGSLTINANLAGSTGLSASGGSLLQMNGALTTTTGNLSLSVTDASTLNLVGGISTPSLVNSLTVGGGSTLSLLDGAGTPFANLTSLNLGNTGTGTVTLNLNVGDGATDTLTLLGGNSAALGNTITFNLTDAGLSAGTTYTLLNLVDGGLTAFGLAKLIQGAMPGGFDAMNWVVDNNQVRLTTGNLIVGSLYWRGTAGGGANDTWNGSVNNWSNDKANTSVAVSLPGQGTDVIFAVNAASGAVTTSLEQNFKINSLTFEAGTSTPTSVTINPGAAATNRLEIAPSAASKGLAITAGGPATVTIATNVKLGANQTWNVVDSGSAISLGALLGTANVTKTGAGKVILTAAADPNFNSAQTSAFTLSGGTLEIQNAGSLGTAAFANLATVSVGSGAAFYYKGVAGTVANPLTLAGGTLSAGDANQIYSGTLAVTADSFVNLADLNGPVTNAARNITLSGVLSGTGSLTLNSNNTVSAGNQIGGTLTLSQVNSGWSGELRVLRGSVIGSNADALGTGAITIENGKVGYTGVGGATYSLNKALTIASATGNAVGEWNVDRTSGTGTFTVTNSGAVTLGGAGGTGELRIFLADTAVTEAIFTGPVTLANNAFINVRDNATSLATISGNIGESGGSRTLTINQLAAPGTWGGTGAILRLTGLNTFTGNVALGSGILEFNTVTDAGGAASSLGQGTAISMAGGTLRFIGGSSQSTNRPITTTGSPTLEASGTGGAVMTYAGAITQTLNNSLNLTGTGEGRISGGITQSGTSADLNINSGIWTLSGAASVFADDIIVTGTSTGTAVLNLNAPFSYANPAAASNGLYGRDGAVINLGGNDLNGANNSGGLTFLLLGDTPSGAAVTLNTNGYNLTVPRLDIGNTPTGRSADVTGAGTLTITGTASDYSTGVRLFRGSIAANLSGPGSMLKQGLGDVTLTGNNSGLNGTVASRFDAGNLILDYTASNTGKISPNAALDMRGATLTLRGSNSAATTQSVASFTLASGGLNTIDITGGTGQTATLNLGAITRATSAGTLRIKLGSGGFVSTTTANSTAHGLLGSSGFATVVDGTGTWFAARDGSNNIVGLASTAKTDVSTWAAGDHVTDEAAGFTGTVGIASINSLRYNAGTGAAVNILPTGVLNLASGGILVTDQVTAGGPGILGGTLASGVGEFILTHDGSQTFEISADLRLNNALTKSGDGLLRLSGNNVYSGATQLQGGTLELIGGNAIGDSSPVVLADDRANTLRLLASETIGRLAGGSTADGLRELAQIQMGAYTLTVNNTGGNTTYAGQFTGSGTLIKNGFGANTNLTLNNISAGFTGTVIVNEGLLQLNNIGQINASAFVINRYGNLLLDQNGTTRSGTRILDNAAIFLNSAEGTFAGDNIVRGLFMRTDQDSATSNTETVGVLNLASGASYAGLQSSGGSSSRAIILAEDFVRANAATFSIRGRALGSNLATGGQSHLRIGNTANQTNFINAMIGGGGAPGTTTQSIVPWAIAENTGDAIATTNLGNSLATYVSGRGFMALDFATDYATYAAAAAQSNVREVLAANLTGLAGKSLNALVLHNGAAAAATYSVTGSGAAQTLNVASGALLFTLNPAAAVGSYGIVLGGFGAGITVGATNEYLFHVVNPSNATASVLTATIHSPLVTAADLTKSGRGTLVLTEPGAAGGGVRKTTLNEGILEIGDLDHIGGSTGGLVFAGGTLRLGAGFADDLSTRSITILSGGATLDTNGLDLALAGSLGSGVGGFTKIGAGNLTLSAVSTYSGPTTVSAGTLTLGINNAFGAGALLIGGGAVLDLASYNLSVSRLTTSGASAQLNGTGMLTSTEGFFLNHTGATTIAAVLAGPGTLLKTQTNVVSLTGASTYTGLTEVQNGFLSFDAIGNVGAGPSPLGNPANAQDAMIRMGLTTAATGLTYTGSGHSSNRLIALQGTTGGVTLNGSGSGAITFGRVFGITSGAKTLTLGGTSALAVNNTLGVIEDGVAAVSVTKADANTWEFTQANTYTGATSINEGVLRLVAGQAMLGALNFGSANTITTAGTLQVRQDASFGSLTAQTNSSANANNLVIDFGKTLTINGNAVIGSGVGALSTTLLNTGGAGNLAVTNAASGATFRVGGSAANGNVSVADLSGLENLTVSLNTTDGVFRVASISTSNVNNTYSTLTLATNTTVTAATLAVGDGGQGAGSVGQINSLYLGAGVNVFNVNTFNIGTTNRDLGQVLFAGETGTLTVRNAAGTGRAAFNLGATQATGVLAPETNRFDVLGHQADLLLGAVAIGTSNRGSPYTNEFSFDTGTLDLTSLTMSTRTAESANGAGLARSTTSTMNLGGGTVIFQNGILAMASAAGAYGTNPAPNMSATLNISGGTVSVGATAGTAMTLASVTATGGTGTPAATAVVNITGGAVTVNGHIVRGAVSGTGTASATVTLDGGTLNLAGNSIGASAATVTLNALSGTLSNLGELNGGGLLTKAGTGTLTLNTANSYTGGTSVTEGVLRISNSTGSATGSGAVTVASGATLAGQGFIAPAAGNAITVNGTLQVGSSGDTAAQQLTLTTTGAGLVTVNGVVAFDLFSGQGSGSLNPAAASDRLVVGGASGFTFGTGAALHVTTSLPIDSSWTVGTEWRLFDWSGLTGGISGSFSNLSSPPPFNYVNLPDLSAIGLAWDASRLYTDGTLVVVVPEPGRALLLCLGLLALFGRRRRP